MAYATSTYIAAAAVSTALAGAGTAVSQSNAAAASARAAAAGLNNNRPIAPKIMPTIDAEAVKKAKTDSLLQLQQRSGRASTLLTNQSPQNNTFG